MQKLLPKLHGSQRKIAAVLQVLGQMCLQPNEKIETFIALNEEINYDDVTLVKYPISLEKILRMYANMMSNGFTSYAEA